MIILITANKQDKKMALRKRGFTLLELMVVTMIIAILASLATVSYRNYTQHATYAEAKQILGHIRDLELIYYEKYDVFANNIDQLPLDSNHLAADWIEIMSPFFSG